MSDAALTGACCLLLGFMLGMGALALVIRWRRAQRWPYGGSGRL